MSMSWLKLKIWCIIPCTHVWEAGKWGHVVFFTHIDKDMVKNKGLGSQGALQCLTFKCLGD